MSEKTDNFIKTVGTLARNEYLGRDVWILPSVCIAQGALESGWNLEASSLFGIKGEGFTATTSEYYNGHYVEIEDSFRSYPNVASAVVGYYDFLRDTPRYANALNNSDYKDTVDKLIHTTDGYPYATDPEYINKIISIIEDFNLTEWDVREDKESEDKEVSFDEIVEAMKNLGYVDYVETDGMVIFSKAESKSINVGDKVRVLVNATYDGGTFVLWHDVYDVIEVEGDRVVIGIGDTVTCAININNIEKV